MRKIILFSTIILLFVWTSFHIITAYGNSDTIKVLFIGNSLTSANNLPSMIADIAKSNGFKIIYDSYTSGGARLANHASNPKVLKKIKEKPWDFVVFQEQSQYPGFSKKQLSRDVFPYAKRLTQSVKNFSNQSKVVFYMAMARRNGDPENKKVSHELLTYEGMQRRVNQCYIEMAKDNGALIAPVGEVWMFIRKNKPSLNLYSDNIHPNKTGTYLAACVFYATFFRKTTVGSHIPKGVNTASAHYIQNTVDKIVLR